MEEKVLIVKIGAIGDVVMALPLLTLIRKKNPNAFITWVCGTQVSALLDSTQLVDEIISVDEKALFQGSLFLKIKTVFQLWKRLLGKSFDLCLTGHADSRYQLLTLPVFCRKKRSFSQKKPIPGRYHTHEYLRLFIGEQTPDLGMNIEFPKLTDRPCPVSLDKPIVVVAPGGAKNYLNEDALRRWPIQHYVDLLRQLATLPIQLVVTGAATDLWVNPYLEGIPHINLIGKLDLLDLTALLTKCKLLITHDSGPLHLSKLAGCPTIALFGPTNPWEKVSRKENISVFWGGEHLSCRPCYDGKTYAKCGNNLCLASISPNSIMKRALEILEKEISYVKVHDA